MSWFGVVGPVFGKAHPTSAEGNESSIWKSIHRVENEIGQGLTQLGFITVQVGQGILEVGLHLNNDSPALGDIPPTRARQFDRLLDNAIDRNEVQLVIVLTSTMEFAHSG